MLFHYVKWLGFVLEIGQTYLYLLNHLTPLDCDVTDDADGGDDNNGNGNEIENVAGKRENGKKKIQNGGKYISDTIYAHFSINFRCFLFF